MSTDGARQSITIGVVRLWPDQPNAEMENLQRLRSAAEMLGARVVELDANGYVTGTDMQEVSPSDVDFVIHMHFETPKCYDAYSYAALWNPLIFYFEWGYDRYSGHLASHDDFLSCGSPWADDHVRRLTWGRKEIAWPLPVLNHTLASPILAPRIPENPKLFYVGINWERLSGRQGRHDGIFKMLDKEGIIKIFGPERVRGVEVWKGFRNYCGPLPFDGKSVVEAIGTCGVSLVLSSEAHRQSELMSNRLFESLAAGAVIISDDNAFVRRNFGDTVLYVGESSEPTTGKEIVKQFEWVAQHRTEAVELAQAAQKIFLKRFSLKTQLAEIIAGHAKRADAHRRLRLARSEEFTVHVVIPIYDSSYSIDQVVTNIASQTYKGIEAEVVIDTACTCDVDGLRKKFGVRTRVRRTNMWARGKRIALGRLLIEDAIACSEELYILAAPSERWFADHVSTLVRLFEDRPETDLAMSDVILKHYAHDGTEHRDYHRSEVDYGAGEEVIGHAVARGKLLCREREAFFAYLHGRNVVRGWRLEAGRVAYSNRGTCVATVSTTGNASNVEEHIQEKILEELANASGKRVRSEERPTGLLQSFDRLSRAEREIFAIKSIKALPLPEGAVRWLRWLGRLSAWWRRR